jgi:hypothetical protein
MPQLFQRLAEYGYDRPYVRKVALPAWWDESVAETPDGYAQTLTLLSRNLGLDLQSLRDSSSQIRCRDFGVTRYKMKQTHMDGDMMQAHCIAARAAELACYALQTPIIPFPPSAAEIRATICKGAKKWVDLDALVAYCWDMGVPVLHVSQFPKHSRKMDGLAARIKGRPAIVLSKNSRYSAWLLFVLAHELGHIVSNHLDEAGMFVDEKVERDDDSEMEVEANEFAVELLTGQRDRSYWVSGNISTPKLAESARIASERDGVDPGVVALNYAWNKGHWAVGQGALALLEPDANPMEAIQARMCARVDWERLPDDSRRFLLRVTGAKGQA